MNWFVFTIDLTSHMKELTLVVDVVAKDDRRFWCSLLPRFRAPISSLSIEKLMMFMFVWLGLGPCVGCFVFLSLNKINKNKYLE